jgi:hypothetical protein
MAQVSSLRSRLWDSGFRPVPVYNPDIPGPSPGKRPWGEQWQIQARREPPAAAVELPRGEALNTGILCDGLRGIDFDIDNPTLAHSCVKIALDMFGEAPTRWRANSPRRLILLRAAEGKPAKLQITGTLGRIEVLGRGQQFVAFGSHESGAELQWMPEAPGEALASNIPAVTEAQIEELLERCALIINAPSPRKRANGHDPDHQPGPPEAELLRIAGALNDIPNEGRADWEWWNRLAMAIWHATGGTEGAWALFDAWSSRNAAYSRTEARAKWDALSKCPPTDIGAGTIFYLAKEARKKKPREEPQPDEEEGQEASAFFDPWEELAPPEWPGGVLPRQIEETLAAISLRDGADYGALCSAYLAAASGAAPKDARFVPYGTRWKVPPILWLLLVAESAWRKTQIAETAFGALRRLHGNRWAEYMDQKRNWDIQAENDKRAAGRPPEPHSYVVNDATPEKLQLILARNRRGTLLLKDELAGFFDFSRYASGGKGASERGFYLESYEGGAYTVHRIGRDSLHIESNALTIFGSIQPARLAEFTGLESDGLLQRFCVIRGTGGRVARPDVQVPHETALDEAIERLARLGGQTYTTTREGTELIRLTERDGTDFASITDYGAGFQGFCGKLHGTHARAALILHFLDNPDEPCIPSETVARARRLIRRWLLPHALGFYSAIPDSNVMMLRDVGGWLLTKAKPRVLASDLMAAVKACRGRSLKEISQMLEPLVAGGWLEPENEFPSNRAWLMNPAVRPAFVARAKSERERRQGIYDRIRSIGSGEDQS